MREFAKEIDVSYVKIEEVIGAGKRNKSGCFRVVQTCGPEFDPQTCVKKLSIASHA